MAELLDGSDDTSSILLAAVDAQRPVLRQAEAGAYAAATAAAAQEVARQLAQLCDAAGGASSSSSGEAAAAIAAAALPQLNTAAERGVDVQAAEEVLGEGACAWRWDDGLDIGYVPLAWPASDCQGAAPWQHKQAG